MTIHDFDMARFFLGEFTEVRRSPRTTTCPTSSPRATTPRPMVMLRNADNALCTIVNSRSCAYGYDQRLEAFGDLGSLDAAN